MSAIFELGFTRTKLSALRAATYVGSRDSGDWLCRHVKSSCAKGKMRRNSMLCRRKIQVNQ